MVHRKILEIDFEDYSEVGSEEILKNDFGFVNLNDISTF